MSTMTAHDVATFSQMRPLNADAWDGQVLCLAQDSYQMVAHDRRGHGWSSQASAGNDMDGCSRLLSDTHVAPALRAPGHQLLGLVPASSLITRQHLARYLLRSSGDDRLDGVITHIVTRDVIDGPEPPPVMLDFQAHLGVPVFRYPAHAVARQARIGFQAGVPFFFVQHGVIPPSRATCGPSSTGNPACGYTHRRS